jgi:aromatic ring-opening dioxygenase catalytic subunit (LigB family)
MASLVGAFASSHGPLIARDWATMREALRRQISASFTEMGRRFEAARPDLLILISPDHWANFFIDNYPTICLGLGEVHEGPPEPFLKDFPWKQPAGHPAFASHLAHLALDNDFEPSLSHHLTLDHGCCIPLLRMELKHLPPIVPVFVNGIEPPMMSIRRCLAWGRLLRQAIESYAEPLRVAILATGGLSHSIGEPTMGAIDEPFDHDCIRLFQAGDDKALIEYLDRALPRTGNGGHEVRNWVIAHAAAGSRGFELIAYEPVPEVYVGCGYASWKIAA